MGKKVFWEYAGITFGAFLIAVSLDCFLVPNKLAAGGVSGLSTVLHHLLGVPVGATMLALNVPLFLSGVLVLGARFGVKTLYGTFVLSVLTDLLAPFLPPLTKDPFLACLYGGTIAGFGLGIVFRYRATTGGTDIVAQLLQHFFKIGAGYGMFIADFVVVALGGLVFGAERALYATLAIAAQTFGINIIEQGISYVKVALVISDRSEEIKEGIFEKLGRGVTEFEAVGGYTGKRRKVLLVAVKQAELHQLKEIVKDIDPKAFVIVYQASEVVGEGFKRL